MKNYPKFSVEKIENFSSFFDSAAKFRTNFFLFYYKKEKSTLSHGVLKYAVLSSKKGVHKRAVKRNKARRRIRHALFAVLKTLDLPAEVAINVLFMANRSVLTAQWERLLQEVSAALVKILAEKEKNLELEMGSSKIE